MFKIKNILSDNSKTVSYCGYDIILPKQSKFVAIDESGRIYAYTRKPTLGFAYHWFAPEFSKYFYIGMCKYDGDWKESLMEI